MYNISCFVTYTTFYTEPKFENTLEYFRIINGFYNHID